MNRKILRISALIIALCMVLPMLPSAVFAAPQDTAKMPETGYTLVIEGEGRITADGIEIASGTTVEVAGGTTVKFLVAPAEGYSVNCWKVADVKSGNSWDGGSSNLYSCYFAQGKYYEIKVILCEKVSYKLFYKLMNNDLDITLSDDYRKVGGDGSSVCTAFVFPGDLTIDEIFNDFNEKSKMIYEFSDFDIGLNYLNIDADEESWIVLRQLLYPSFDYAENKPIFIGGGFVVSDESMVMETRTVQSERGHFEGYNYIVLKITGDITITSMIHNIEYTSVTIENDISTGTVFISPKRALVPNYWWEGTVLTLKANAKEGYRFDHWIEKSGSVIKDQDITKNPLVITVGSEDIYIEPVFVSSVSHNRSIIVLKTEGVTNLLVNGSAEVLEAEEGSVVSVKASVDEYYTFDHWEIYQNGIDAPYNLVTPAERDSLNTTFTMPFGEGGVTIKAITSDRFANLVCINGIINESGWSSDSSIYVAEFSLVRNGESADGKSCKVQKGDLVGFALNNTNPEGYGFDHVDLLVNTSDGFSSVASIYDQAGEFVIPGWDSYSIVAMLFKKGLEHETPIAPVISNGSVERIGERTATVRFISDSVGAYYYAIADEGIEVVVDTTKNGVSALEGENTIRLNTLTPEAKEIHIVIKNTNGVESEPYIIRIPAYDKPVENHVYTITINVPQGGSLTTNKVTAKSGEVIVITVLAENGYQLKSGTLSYTVSETGGETVAITGYSFVMPPSDICISCIWERIYSEGSSGLTSENLWSKLADCYEQIPWWQYAEEQNIKGNYPVYW